MNFLEFPNEILFKIIGYLDFPSLLDASLICKRISLIANERIEKIGSLKLDYFFLFPTVKQNEIHTFSFQRNYLKHISFKELDFYFEAEKLLELSAMFNVSAVLRAKELKIVQEFGSLNDRDCVANIVRFLGACGSIEQLTLHVDFEILCEDLVAAVKRTLPRISIKIEDKSELDPDSLIVEYFYTTRTEESQKLWFQNFGMLKKALIHPNSFTTTMNFVETLEFTTLDKLKLCSLYTFGKLSGDTSLNFRLKELILFSNQFEIPAERYDYVEKICKDNSLSKLLVDIKGGEHISRIISCTNHLNLKEITINMASAGDFKNFAISLLNQHAATLTSVHLKYFDIDNEVLEALNSVEKILSLRLAYCSINFQTPLNTKHLKRLDLTGSRMKFDTLNLILSNNFIQNSLEDLYLEKICLGFVFNPLDISHLSYNFKNLRRLNIMECPVNRFVSQQLTSLKTDYNMIPFDSKSEAFTEIVTCLSLGELKTLQHLEFLLDKFSNVNFLEIISRFELYDVLELLKQCKQLRCGVIYCKWTRNLQYEEDIQRIFLEFEGCDIFRENTCVKISNRDRTIFVHNMNSSGLSHIYYKNFLQWLWD